MKTTIIGKEFHHFEELDSTQSVAKQWISKNNPSEGCVISAAFQSAGRGRNGKHWIADKGSGLMMSIILYPSFLQPMDTFLLNAITCNAMYDAVASCLHPSSSLKALSIKWSNDLLWNGGKLGGVLIDASWQKNSCQYVIIGIGLNVTASPTIQEPTAYPPTHFPAHAAVSVQEIRQALLMNLDKAYVAMVSQYATEHSSNEREKIISSYEKRLYGLGEPCILKSGDQTAVTGTLLGVDALGCIKIKTEKGIQSFASGSLWV